MRAGAVPSLALVVVEVSDYAPPVADVSRARIKVFNTSCSSSPAPITFSSSIALALLFG